MMECSSAFQEFKFEKVDCVIFQDDASSTQRLDTGQLTKVSKVSPDGSSKVLLSWLESLPKSEADSLDHIAPPSPHTSHNNSIDSNINTINRRNQTLTRTNPYRHKVSLLDPYHRSESPVFHTYQKLS